MDCFQPHGRVLSYARSSTQARASRRLGTCVQRTRRSCTCAPSVCSRDTSQRIAATCRHSPGFVFGILPKARTKAKARTRARISRKAKARARTMAGGATEVPNQRLYTACRCFRTSRSSWYTWGYRGSAASLVGCLLLWRLPVLLLREACAPMVIQICLRLLIQTCSKVLATQPLQDVLHRLL